MSEPLPELQCQVCKGVYFAIAQPFRLTLDADGCIAGIPIALLPEPAPVPEVDAEGVPVEVIPVAPEDESPKPVKLLRTKDDMRIMHATCLTCGVAYNARFERVKGPVDERINHAQAGGQGRGSSIAASASAGDVKQ